MDPKRLALVSFVCAGIGLLLVFEVIRPFRDMVKEGPLAIILWGIGAAFGIVSFFPRPRAIAVSIAPLLVNLVPMCGLAAMLVLLARSTLIWH